MRQSKIFLKPRNPGDVHKLTSKENFSDNENGNLVLARKVYFVLLVCALSSFAGSLVHLVHHFRFDVSFSNFLVMLWWISYLSSRNSILISIIGACFFFGLTVGGPDVATYCHLNERTLSYALASVALLFASQMAAMFTHSPAVVFNINIVSLPLFIYVFVFTQNFFSFPFKPNNSPPSSAFMTYIRNNLLTCSLFFFAFIACVWFTILKFFRVFNLRFGYLVPVHLHLLSLLIDLPGYSVYYITGVYTVLLLFVYNVRYHILYIFLPPVGDSRNESDQEARSDIQETHSSISLNVSDLEAANESAQQTANDVPQERYSSVSLNESDQEATNKSGLEPANESDQEARLEEMRSSISRNESDQEAANKSGQKAANETDSFVLNFFTLFLGRSTYNLSQLVYVLMGRIIRHVEFGVIWAAAKSYGLSKWQACYKFYDNIIKGGKKIVDYFINFMFQAAVVSFILVVCIAIIFAFKS